MARQPFNMAFEVKNLGVVKQGRFTQKPLTLFCGPNNSGKTWVMYALYYCHKLIANFRQNKYDHTVEICMSSLEDLCKTINRDLARVFNTGKDLFKNAMFIPQLSEEQFYKQIQKMHSTFLLPAERAGLNLFYRELSTRRTALLHHASKESIDLYELLRDVIQSPYSRPIADYIDWLNQLSESQRNSQGDFHRYGEFLKRKLVQGVYTVSRRTGEITFKPYQRKRDGNATPVMGLHLTSSTVKSLFGLWFYLENQVKVGDLLMIDEPELNLHPQNQRILARLLAQLVNAGLNVVISTHSDYIVREFNSLIMLNDKRAQPLREKHQYQEDEVLDPAMVGAYLFDDQKITHFKTLPGDGIYASTFDEVIRDLNQVNDDIYYSLQESGDE